MRALTEGISASARNAARSPLVIIVIALLFGALLAPMAYSTANEYANTTDKVAVIDAPPLIVPETAAPVKEQLQEARENESIKAVVLKVDTPGGGLAATESLALEIERTAEEMPVVASVESTAASGGYYISAPTDYIVANPGALIGSVGINFQHFGSTSSPTVIQSGPDKAGGFTEDEAIEYATIMVEGFYGTVLENRGDDLELTKEELAYAKVYPSQVALHNGMIDEIGTTDTAIQHAADMAGLDRYEVVHLETGFELFPGGLVLETTDGMVVDVTHQKVKALLDPHPGVNTPVPMALYGDIPDEQLLVTTEGDTTATAITDDATEDDTSHDDTQEPAEVNDDA